MPDPVFLSSVRMEVRLDNGVVWTELPDVLLSPTISISRGMSGSSPKDRVANSGSMSFALNNAEDNSFEELGVYSPNRTNCIDGWRVGIPIRCVVTYAGTDYILFTGFVDSIEPSSGQFKERRVEVTVTDWMEEAARSAIRGLPVQINQRSSKIFQIVAEGVQRQPPGGLNIQPGADLFEYALDSAHQGEINAMSEFQRIAQSELSRVYVTREGVLTYESRHFRPNQETLFISLTDADIDDQTGLETGRGREDIVNLIQAQVHPRRVDATPTTVLFELSGQKKIQRNTSEEVTILLRDPESRATRVGGLDMVQPVPTTDYLFNTLQNGTGTDITSQLTVEVEYSANGGEATITNNGPLDGYLTKLQCRGRGIYSYETVLVRAESIASKQKYGEADMSYDMPYQSDFGVAEDAADFILQQSKELLTQIRGVKFIGNREHRLMIAALTGEISKKIDLSETMVGVRAFLLTGQNESQVQQIEATKFFINGVDLEIGERGIIRATWLLEPGDPFSYWKLDILGFTELNQTTRLAYGAFQLAWVLNFDELGVGTRLADQ